MTRVLAVAALVLALAGCSGITRAATMVEVPNVIPEDLDLAYAELEDLGLVVEAVAASGEVIIIRSNWSVVEQMPVMGETVEVGSTVKLTVVKPEDSASTEVQWGDYAPELQSRIDSLGAAADCPGLEAERTSAVENDTATLTRTGHNNAALLMYVSDAQAAAGCP